MKLHRGNNTAHNSAQAQFGHLGKLIIWISLYLGRRSKDSGHQYRTAPAIETLVATDRLQTK